MKKRLLLFTLAVTFSCFVAFAQDFQASGTWEKFPSNYKDYSISMVDRLGDDYVVLLTYKDGYVLRKKLAVVDEHLQILRSMDFNDRITPKSPYGKDGKPSSGTSKMTIQNGILDYLYADYDNNKQCRVLTRQSYDLESMKHVKNEELMCATDLEPNAKDLIGGLRMWDFDSFDEIWSENREYVCIIAHRIDTRWRCVNLTIYDRQFNKVAEAMHLDTFRIPKMKYKEQVLRFQDYDYDYAISNEGKLTFVRSVSKRFLQSDGSDVAIYELSKDGLKRYDFGRTMGHCQFYSPELLQVKDGKVLVFGIYAPIAEKKDFKLEGSCTLELNLETNEARQVEMIPFEKAAKGTWRHDFLSEDNIATVFGPIWKTPQGWIKVLNPNTSKTSYVAFLDETGCIKSMYPLNKNIDSKAQYVHNNKFYYVVWLKDYLISVDENGKEEQHPIPYSLHLYKDDQQYLHIFKGHEKPSTWSFFKTSTTGFVFGKLQFSE